MILVARRFEFSMWLIELFRAVEQALGKREIIAEDLGYTVSYTHLRAHET